MTFIRRVLMLALAAAIILPVISCDKINEMMGKKDDAAQQALQAQQDQKMKDLEAKVLQMQADEQARKDAEAKAKAEADKAQEEQAMKDKIEADLKAQAQTQPTTQPTTAAVTTTTTTTTPAQPPKVVERVIVKEVPAKPAVAATPAPAVAANPTGYVKLYDDKGFTDRSLTVRFGRDVGNMRYVNSDDGKSGFNDKASAVKWSVPAGWQAVLYENDNYAKRGYVLKGSGSQPDLGYFGDKCSSLRWERTSE